MSRPKLLQFWSDPNKEVQIKLRTTDSQVILQYNVDDNCAVKSGGDIIPLKASEDGWILWSGKKIINPSDSYQLVGSIYKQKKDLGEATLIKDELQSTSMDESSLTNKLKFIHLGKMMENKFIIEKWKVRVNDFVNVEQIIGEYQSPFECNKLISHVSGRVLKLAPINIELTLNDTLIELSVEKLDCKHLKIENENCVYCGQKVELQQVGDNNCFPGWQLDKQTQMKYSMERINEIVWKQKKLIMILDLDQTILHAIKIRRDFPNKQFVEQRNNELLQKIKLINPLADNIDNYINKIGQISEYIKEHFLEMSCDNKSKFLIKLRPYYEQFFQELFPIFDICIYTKASRTYADYILQFLQETIGPHFSNRQLFPPHRILSRDDTIDHTSKNLNRIFPPGVANNFMIILDDNAQMWSRFMENYLPTKPFVYFLEGAQRDIQGINCEIEQEARIMNTYDFWLLSVTQQLKNMAMNFWKQVEDAPLLQNLKRDKKNLKSSQKNLEIVSENIQKQVSPLTLEELINQSEINVQNIYEEKRKSILAGINIYFAICKQHTPEVQQLLEKARTIARKLGAKKIYTEFRESYFNDGNTIIVTHELKKIKSIIVAQENKYPLVHMQWVYDCELYLNKLSFDAYDLSVKSVQQIENEAERHKEMKNDFLKREGFLQLN